MNNSYLLADVARGRRDELIATAANFRRRKQPHRQKACLPRLVHRAEVVPSLLRPGDARTIRKSASAKT